MPTYQYRCDKCGHAFEHVEHVAEHESARMQTSTPLQCPRCGSANTLQHAPTQFFARTSKKS